MIASLRTRKVQVGTGAAIGAAFGVVVGLAGAIATAAVGAAVIFGFAVFVSVGGRRGEGWQLARGEGDERLRRVQAESAQIVLGLVAIVAVAGWLWDEAHGHFGAYGVMCTVLGGATLLVPQVLKRYR